MSFKIMYFEICQLFMCHIEQTNCRATCLNLPDSIKQLVWLHATIQQSILGCICDVANTALMNMYTESNTARIFFYSFRTLFYCLLLNEKICTYFVISYCTPIMCVQYRMASMCLLSLRQLSEAVQSQLRTKV